MPAHSMDAPKWLIHSIEAGLDDLKNNRGVPGEQVLARLDQVIAEMEQERCSNENTTSD